MADTTGQLVTGEWVKVSESDCTIQCSKPGAKFDVSIGVTAPTEAALILLLDEPTTFSYKSPVWLRLHAKGNASYQRQVAIIK